MYFPTLQGSLKVQWTWKNIKLKHCYCSWCEEDLLNPNAEHQCTQLKCCDLFPEREICTVTWRCMYGHTLFNKCWANTRSIDKRKALIHTIKPQWSLDAFSPCWYLDPAVARPKWREVPLLRISHGCWTSINNPLGWSWAELVLDRGKLTLFLPDHTLSCTTGSGVQTITGALVWNSYKILKNHQVQIFLFLYIENQQKSGTAFLPF